MIPATDLSVGMRGRKPRASGDDPGSATVAPGGVRVNPARAGMILRAVPMRWPARSKPRASGDDPRNAINERIAEL